MWRRDHFGPFPAGSGRNGAWFPASRLVRVSVPAMARGFLLEGSTDTGALRVWMRRQRCKPFGPRGIGDPWQIRGALRDRGFGSHGLAAQRCMRGAWIFFLGRASPVASPASHFCCARAFGQLAIVQTSLIASRIAAVNPCLSIDAPCSLTARLTLHPWADGSVPLTVFTVSKNVGKTVGTTQGNLGANSVHLNPIQCYELNRSVTACNVGLALVALAGSGLAGMAG